MIKPTRFFSGCNADLYNNSNESKITISNTSRVGNVKFKNSRNTIFRCGKHNIVLATNLKTLVVYDYLSTAMTKQPIFFWYFTCCCSSKYDHKVVELTIPNKPCYVESPQ